VGKEYSSRLFYIPAVVYLALFAFLPFVFSIFLSTPNADFSSYLLLFEFPELHTVLLNTLIFSLGTAGFSTLLGLALAIFADMISHGKRLVTLLAYLPYTIPFTAGALVWTLIYDPIFGPANFFLRTLHLPGVNWLGSPSVQVYSETIVSIWTGIPFAFLIILAGLNSIPKELKEAAKVDQLTKSEYYTSIALKLAKGAILVSFLMSLIISFGNFDLPYILNGGYSYSMATLPFLVWFQIFYQNQVSQGLAGGVILAAMVSVPAFLLIRVLSGGGSRKEGGARRRRAGTAIRIPDRMFMLLVGLVAAVVIFFLLFPIYWMFLVATRSQFMNFVYPPVLYPSSLTFTTFVQTFNQAKPYLVTTSVVSAVAMGITILISAPAAYFAARHRARWLVYLCVYLFSLPSTSFVFGVYFMIAKLGLLNTWLALILTYPVFTVPFAVWTLSNFYSQLPRQYEEAALIDGHSVFNAFFRIVMPIARPGLIATSLLSFVFSWHLLLFPLVLSQTPYQFNFPPTGSFAITNFATLFDPTSLGSSVSSNIWGQVGSAGLIAALPVMILAILAQNYLLKGIYTGGVKG
jgi:ABC-type glycerol-3-phosphate transport system permease component